MEAGLKKSVLISYSVAIFIVFNAVSCTNGRFDRLETTMFSDCFYTFHVYSLFVQSTVLKGGFWHGFTD